MEKIIEQVHNEYLKQVMNLILDNLRINDHRKLYNIYYEIRIEKKKEISPYNNRMPFKEFDKLIIEADKKLRSATEFELVEILC